MKKFLCFTIVGLLTLTACKNDSENETQDKTNTESENILSKPSSDLIVDEHGEYIQYYPGKKQIKFYGKKDRQLRRHGKWTHYSESGQELSYTFYVNGKKHGFSMVKYPNGQVHYYGDYDNDVQVGIWKVYDENGKLVEEKNFDEEKK